jgi:hypothetical protein
VQPIQRTEISRRSPHLFSATEVAESIGADLKTINEWLEVGAIDRAVFGFKIRTTTSGTYIRNGETWACSSLCKRRRLGNGI